VVVAGSNYPGLFPGLFDFAYIPLTLFPLVVTNPRFKFRKEADWNVRSCGEDINSSLCAAESVVYVSRTQN